MTAAGELRREVVSEVLVARQPILDRDLQPYGYELLCRVPGGDGFPAGMDLGRATAAVIARSLLTLGLHAVTGGKPAYVNVHASLLDGGELAALPAELVGLELGRDIGPGARDIVAALRDRGYRLVLDGVAAADDPRLDLLDIVDGAKLDFGAADAAARRLVAARALAAGVDLMAGKVETAEQASEAFALGCRYVQGYFFAEPLVLARRQPPGFKPSHVRLLAAVQRPDLDFAELEQVIKTDLLLSHQFLRYINVAQFGWRRTITSLRHAFVLLGEHRARQWVSLVVLADLAQDKPQQLAVTACLRARFCELLGAGVPALADRTLDLYLLGMFSLIDAVLDRPMVAAISGMPLPPDVTAALLGEKGAGPGGVAAVLAAVRAYERGDWHVLDLACAAAGICEDALLPAYLDAVEWVSGIFAGEEPRESALP